MKFTRIAVQLNEHVGLHDNAARPLAFSVQLVGHLFGGVVLFSVFEHVLRIRARHIHNVEVNTDLALRANGAVPGASLLDVAIAGAVGGSAHAVATSPLVSWQRSGSVFPAKAFSFASARNFSLVVARDSASFSSFFVTFTAAFKPRDDGRDSMRAAVSGGVAGFVCHAVRFPLQTLYKRGRGWISPDSSIWVHARRFFQTTARAILPMSIAFGAYEALATYVEQASHGGSPA